MNRLPTPPETDQAIMARLCSAQGHLRAVADMLADGEPCEHVLQQLTAVQAALSAVGRLLVCRQVRLSSEVIRSSPCAEARIAEIDRLVSLSSLPGRFHLPQEKPSYDRKPR